MGGRGEQLSPIELETKRNASLGHSQSTRERNWRILFSSSSPNHFILLKAKFQWPVNKLGSSYLVENRGRIIANLDKVLEGAEEGWSGCTRIYPRGFCTEKRVCCSDNSSGTRVQGDKERVELGFLLFLPFSSNPFSLFALETTLEGIEIEGRR